MATIVTNPYQVGGMIRDREQFVGRDREIREILGRVATMQSVSVVGERRIGKSSLLYHLKDTGSERLRAAGYKDYELRYLDVQPLVSAEEFYTHACRLIEGPNQVHGLALGGKDDLEKAVSGRKLMLCLDEFEQTVEADFGSEFFKFLRHLAQSGDIAFIIATKSPLSELYLSDEELTSGFPNVFTTLRLDELAEGEARALVETKRNSHSFSSQEVDKILELAGTHPYWLNFVCAQAYEAKQVGRLDSKAFNEIENRLKKERAMAESTRASEAKEAQPVSALLGTQAIGAPPVKDPNAALRWSLILTLVSLAIGGFSALAPNPPGMVLAFALLAVALLLLLLQAFKRRRTR